MHLDPEQTEESEDRGRQSVLGNREPEGIDRPGFSSFFDFSPSFLIAVTERTMGMIQRKERKR